MIACRADFPSEALARQSTSMKFSVRKAGQLLVHGRRGIIIGASADPCGNMLTEQRAKASYMRRSLMTGLWQRKVAKFAHGILSFVAVSDAQLHQYRTPQSP